MSQLPEESNLVAWNSPVFALNRWSVSCIGLLTAVLPLATCRQAPPLDQKQAKAVGVEDTNYRLLFIGNSHTGSHNLPQLVARLIQFQDSSKKVYAESIQVGFLEEVAASSFHRRLETVQWNAVILQAQKISSSGKYVYSTSEGVEFARLARQSGLDVFFFAEWGLQGDDGNAQLTDEIYRTMAQDSDTTLIPVGQVWRSVLAGSPDLPLYASDGNHQSRLGASLTSLTIASYLSGTSPMEFATFDAPAASPGQWKLFCAHTTQIHSAKFEQSGIE